MSSTTTASKQSNSSIFVGLPAVPPNDPSLTSNTTQPRKVRKVVYADEQNEGMGARVRRSIGIPQLRNYSPFLMLDHFSVSRGAGFPDHPHRGQETITYLLEGAMDHEDFAGNRGTIWPGDLQFMTAGRGIMHAEIPRHDDTEKPVTGMQLWVDLPKNLKSCEPRYRDLRAKEIPTVEHDDGKVEVKIISGQSAGVNSVQELAYTPVWLLDVRIRPGGKLVQNMPSGWNVFAYTWDGTTKFSGGQSGSDGTKTAEKYHNVVFEQAGDAVVAEVDVDAESDARFILVAGMPLDQKVVQYGPFVLSSQEEVYQAMFDFQGHANGFERAEGWQSEIGKAMKH
ncbi:MAG: hypothetical protein M1831_005494 [Alyxoria varia]|nr:MAG: hypothetical protein M1831_005494 [Alyxoria varia]